jgi:hypothetical protein
MVIICGAMLTIQLLAYFAYQPIGSASYSLTTYTGAAIAHWRVWPGPQLSSLWLLSCPEIHQMGDIMYALANIDFSDRLGFVVSELTPEENDQASNSKKESAVTSLPVEALEVAVFGAA